MRCCAGVLPAVQATLLLKDAYDLAKVRNPNSSQQQWIEEAQGKVAELLWEDAYEVITREWAFLCCLWHCLNGLCAHAAS